MKGVELYAQVRFAVQIEGVSRREAARRFGIDSRTVATPGYRRSRPAARPKLDPYTGIIDGILAADEVGRESSGIPRSGCSTGFATSTAILAVSPSLRTTCWRTGCDIARCSFRCGTIRAMRRWILARRWRRSRG